MLVVIVERQAVRTPHQVVCLERELDPITIIKVIDKFYDNS